jgi:hypothetical protein
VLNALWIKAVQRSPAMPSKSAQFCIFEIRPWHFFHSAPFFVMQVLDFADLEGMENEEFQRKVVFLIICPTQSPRVFPKSCAKICG